MIAAKMRDYLREKGFQQKTIAHRAGMSEVALCNTLNGRRKLTADEFVNLCAVLEVSPNYFTES